VKKNRAKLKQKKFILGAVYIHPNVPQEAIEYFMFKCSALALKPLDWSFRTWTPTPILRFCCAEILTWTLFKTNHLWTLWKVR